MVAWEYLLTADSWIRLPWGISFLFHELMIFFTNYRMLQFHKDKLEVRVSPVNDLSKGHNQKSFQGSVWVIWVHSDAIWVKQWIDNIHEFDEMVFLGLSRFLCAISIDDILVYSKKKWTYMSSSYSFEDFEEEVALR